MPKPTNRAHQSTAPPLTEFTPTTTPATPDGAATSRELTAAENALTDQAFRRDWDRLVRKAKSITKDGDVAQDVVSAMFTKVIEEAREPDGPGFPADVDAFCQRWYVKTTQFASACSRRRVTEAEARDEVRFAWGADKQRPHGSAIPERPLSADFLDLDGPPMESRPFGKAVKHKVVRVDVNLIDPEVVNDGETSAGNEGGESGDYAFGVDEGVFCGDELTHSDIVAAIWPAFRQLAPRQKDVLHLHDVEGCTHEETAALLRISEQTCKEHIGVARSNLRRILLASDAFPRTGFDAAKAMGFIAALEAQRVARTRQDHARQTAELLERDVEALETVARERKKRGLKPPAPAKRKRWKHVERWDRARGHVPAHAPLIYCPHRLQEIATLATGRGARARHQTWIDYVGLAESRLGAPGVCWDSAFVYFAGVAAHRDARSTITTWPVPCLPTVHEVGEFAYHHHVLRAKPELGDLFLTWSAERQAFDRCGIVMELEGYDSVDGKRTYACQVAEGAPDKQGAHEGFTPVFARRLVSIAAGDRFVRWTELPFTRTELAPGFAGLLEILPDVEDDVRVVAPAEHRAAS